MRSSVQTKTGVAYGLAAYIWWAAAIFWFKAVSHVPAPEVVAHRLIWSAVLLICSFILIGRVGELIRVISDRRSLLTLASTAGLIAFNWLVFVWAVANDRVIETSLGYYINPLVNVLLGYVFLKERLRPAQIVSVLLATLGMLILGISHGQIPIVSLTLAFTFGLYGLLRKTVPVNGITGLTVETTILTPLALAYMLYQGQAGNLIFTRLDRITDLLLVAAGIVSAIPLVWYVNAAKRLRYASLGLMMYIMPSATFLIAVFVFGEPFGRVQLISFCCIWVALLIYSIESVRESRTNLECVPSAGSDEKKRCFPVSNSTASDLPPVTSLIPAKGRDLDKHVE